MKDKRIVFMGTPDFAIPVLECLIKDCNVVGVVTKPDKLVGRKQELSYSPIKKVAIENNIKVFQPIKIKEDYEFLKELNIDLIVTCAYGNILSKNILDIPKYGSINVHASLLPKYRGSAPIQWALFNGDNKTGITIMKMDEGMDTGDIIRIKDINILDNDNVGSLHVKLSILGASLLEETLPTIFNGTYKSTKQGSDYSVAPMITRDLEQLDFYMNGKDIINRIRGLNPWPLANVTICNKEIKVIEAEFKKSSSKELSTIVDIDKKHLGISCKDGIIYLKKVKPSGKKVMDITSFLNGIDVSDLKGMKVNS